MSKPTSIYNTICSGMRLNSPSVSRARPRCRQKQGRPLQSQIFAKFLPAFGPSWKSRLQRRNLDYKDPADRLIGMMLLQIITNHECLPSFKRKGKKKLVSVLKAQDKKPRGHFLFLSSSLSLS